MSCKGQLEPPTPKLPDGIKVPFGDSIDKVKNFAKGGGIGTALSNVGGMVSGELSALAANLNPAALAAKIGANIAGAIGNITSAVTGALGQLTSLKDKIKGFNPASKFKSFGGVDDIKDKIKGQLPGKDEFKMLKNAQQGADCAGAELLKRAQAQAAIVESAKAAAAKITAKAKVAAAKDPVEKQKLQDELVAETEKQTQAKLEEQANKSDKSEKSAGLASQEETLTMAKKGAVVTVVNYVDSVVTKTQVGWSIGEAPEPSTINDLFKQKIQTFISSVGADKQKDISWSDNVVPDAPKHMEITTDIGQTQFLYSTYAYRAPWLSSDSGPGYWDVSFQKSTGVPIDPDNSLFSLYITSYTSKQNDRYFAHLYINLKYTHTQAGNDFFNSRGLLLGSEYITDVGENLSIGAYKQGLNNILLSVGTIDPLTGVSILSNLVTKY